jgi:D-alanyl-D-alanine carboxypeptidase (penicillin-binding protein 5/6)
VSAHRRRPRTALRGALTAAALVTAAGGCGSSAEQSATTKIAGTHQALQIANGPVAAAVATSPLTLQLAGTPDKVPLHFGHPPRSGLLFDLDTGQVLWRKDPTRILPIASVTKIMTALVVNDRVPPGSKVLVTKQSLAYQGSGVGMLPKNKWVGVSAMLYGLMLPSGNDAAIALAQRASGDRTVATFVMRMNRRAAAMGLICTHYSTPSGFEDRGNRSCAADLAVQARALLDVPRLAKIVGVRRVAIPFPIKGGKLFLSSHNPLMLAGYPGTIGIKTGFTDAAGHCFVAAVQRNGRRLGVVLLHSPNARDQARKLFDRGFAAIS